MTNQSKIKNLIKSLREKTIENGCTQDEAEAAAQKVLDLLHKYDLSESDSFFDNVTLTLKTRKKRVADDLCTVISTVTETFAYFSKDVENRNIVYYGTAANVEVAKYLHEVIINCYDAAEQEFKESSAYTRRRTRKTKNNALKLFARAFVDNMAHRLFNLWWRKSGHKNLFDALETSNHNIAILKETLKETGLRFSQNKALAKPTCRFDDAVAQGEMAAKKAAINPGVNRGDDSRLIAGGV